MDGGVVVVFGEFCLAGCFFGFWGFLLTRNKMLHKGDRHSNSENPHQHAEFITEQLAGNYWVLIF